MALDANAWKPWAMRRRMASVVLSWKPAVEKSDTEKSESLPAVSILKLTSYRIFAAAVPLTIAAGTDLPNHSPSDLA